jgi:hypothetical protein
LASIIEATIDDLIQLDRKRKGKKLSNKDWASKTDPDGWSTGSIHRPELFFASSTVCPSTPAAERFGI